MKSRKQQIVDFLSAEPFERQYKVANVLANFWGKLVYRRRFLSFGRGVILKKPSQIFGAKFIEIGDRARFETGSILYAIRNYSSTPCDGRITIGKNTYFNRGFNASAAAPITIGDGVTVATNVFLCNYDHGFEDLNSTINEQPLRVRGPLSIGENSWLGANVCVLGSVSIGKHVVIGANSVVSTDIPDYSVAVGSPARVVRKYDQDTRTWLKVSIQ